MRNIKFYIDRKAIDLPNQLSIPMNFTLEDVNSPATKKIGYSKTISIEGTNNNNQIFGEIWNIERIQDYAMGTNCGIYFDPSKRVNAEIYINDELKFEGFVKLDSINYNKPQIIFNLTFYAGLGDFFYSLSANENGDERTLAELDYGYDLGFRINKGVILDAWSALSGNTEGKYQVINFAPAYNGVPDDFAADKALINVSGQSYFPTSISGQSGYAPVNGYALADLNNEYTDLEMDLRSYLQRPVLRVKSLIQAMDNPDINGGYHLNLDRGFFNEENPYWENAWITLPTLKSLDDVGGEEYTGSSVPVSERLISSIPYPVLMSFTGQISGEEIDMSAYSYGTFNFTVPVSFRVDTSTMGSVSPIGSNLYPTYRLEYTYKTKRYDEQGENLIETATTEIRYVGDYIGARLIAYNGNNEIIATSNQYIFTNFSKNLNVSSSTPVTKVDGYFKYDNGQWILTAPDGRTEFDMEISNVPIADTIKFNVEINRKPTFLYNRDYGTRVDEETDEQGVVTAESTPFPFENNRYYFKTNSGDLAFTEEASTHSGVEISQRKLLGNLRTPCDYLLSYAKMFGLYFVKHPYEKTITLMARNKFFRNNVTDLNNDIDWGSKPTMKPILFDSKWYTLKNEAEESEFIEKYNNDYDSDYAEQKINTGYNFDSEENDVMAGSKFKTAVFARGKSKYYRTFKEGDTVVPCCMFDGITYNLFKESGNTYANASKDMVMSSGTYINWYPKKGGYDCFPKLDFKDANNGGVNGENVLCFFDGFRELKDNSGNYIDKYVTDDVLEMWALNDESPCWFITSVETENATKVEELPCFSRYITNGNNVLKSFDYGEPKELYVDNLHSTSETTIYNQFWKAFLNDQLDINTRIFTANVKFNEILNEDNLRNIYYFQNSYWILNKIIDYDICSFNTVKCEFIKIQDTNDYTNGQILPYLDAHINIEGHQIYNHTISTGNTSGSLDIECLNVENIRLSDSPNWLALHLNEDNTLLIYSALENRSEMSRRAQIKLVGENVVNGEEIVGILNITQTSFQILLEVQPDIVTAPAQGSGETYSGNVTCNGAWVVSSKPDWVDSLAGTGGTYNGVHYFSIRDNETTEARNGDIIYTSGNKAAIQRIRQEAYVPPTPTGGTKIYYTSNNGNIVTPYNTTGWTANIVSNTYVDGQGVIEFDGEINAVPSYAFNNCKRLKSIILPNGIISIGQYAFNDCENLNNIDIPETVTNFEGDGASNGDTFNGCTYLKEIKLPSKITSIPPYMFYRCVSLTEIDIPTGVANIGRSAFSKCTSLRNANIPSGVTVINSGIFYKCSSLRNIEIPSGVTNIGDFAFEKSALEEIVIPSSVARIVRDAFLDCSALTRVVIERVTPPAIGTYTFDGSTCPIIVPCGSEDTYKTNPDWNKYASRIVGDCPPEPTGDTHYLASNLSYVITVRITDDDEKTIVPATTLTHNDSISWEGNDSIVIRMTSPTADTVRVRNDNGDYLTDNITLTPNVETSSPKIVMTGVERLRIVSMLMKSVKPVVEEDEE